MPTRKAITEKEGVYFITFTCTNWLPLFKICHAYDAVYNWFNNLKEQGHYIIGYVIMPSHVHAIIAFPLLRNVSQESRERSRDIAAWCCKCLLFLNFTGCQPVKP